MQRKSFLKNLLLGAVSAPVVLSACSKEDVAPTTESATDADALARGGTSSSCTVSPAETEGPFPTHAPSSYVRSNIVDGRSGHVLRLKISIVKASNSCAALAGALVDIWHCDADGNYSEYGGSGMQQTNYQSVHFLRGRQVTNANGVAEFTSIFPGWYNGRATHIHVHVYNAAGQSLKVTQIAFPEGTGSAVVAVNGYTKGMNGYTYNSRDNVFSDDTTKAEVATVTGSTANGFDLAMKITV